jgi:hypothetical protein
MQFAVEYWLIYELSKKSFLLRLMTNVFEMNLFPLKGIKIYSNAHACNLEEEKRQILLLDASVQLAL